LRISQIEAVRPASGSALDSNGNTLTSVTGSNTTTYAWDFENRLTSVTLPGTGGTVSFKYDPFGRRIYKSSLSGTSIYAYDGDNLIEETNSSGAAIARYSQTQNIDDPLAMLRSGATSYYHADGLGSVTSLSNGAGVLAQTYTFDSFGRQTASSGSLTNPFRYTGREFDTETSLYFYRARYYDPNVGRFISEDPTGFDGGDVNVYRYSFNQPVLLIDPSGLTVTCSYNQVSGGLTCTDDTTGQLVVNTIGYSGGNGGRCSECVNNPYFQWAHDQGPIPVGNYNIGPGYPWNGMQNVLRLTPQPGSSQPAFDRSPGFLIHGDKKNGPPKSASKGCIVVDPLSRRAIGERGGGTLNVFNPDPFFTVYPRRNTPFQ